MPDTKVKVGQVTRAIGRIFVFCLTLLTNHEQTVIERQIEATDRETDRLVYELYGLSEEDIKIVQEATK